MSFLKKNQLFTLSVIPDSGNDVKSGNINLRFIKLFFAALITLFFTCLFFVIGYHVKLRQEKDYISTVSTMQEHMNNIYKYENLLNSLSIKLSKIQIIDKAFRQYAHMSVPDDDMYKAGIGGHVIVDDSIFGNINKNLLVNLRNLLLKINIIDRQVFVEEYSLKDIRDDLKNQRDEINNTPTILPTQSLNITSGYGLRKNPVTGVRHFHDAVDFTGRRGDKIFATADGIAIKEDFHNVRGKYIVIKHNYGYQTLYAHLNNILVYEGQSVKKYDVIGTMGSSGRTTGVNLHYSITHNNRKVNPLSYF